MRFPVFSPASLDAIVRQPSHRRRLTPPSDQKAALRSSKLPVDPVRPLSLKIPACGGFEFNRDISPLEPLELDTHDLFRDNAFANQSFRLKEVTMKTTLVFAICVAMAAPILCQSPSVPTGQQEKEQQLRTALEQMRDAIDRYHG